MKQKKILLKSYDVQPFSNEDEFIYLNLNSSAKQIRDKMLINNFDLSNEYTTERNNSRKFFVYGRLYGKQADTNGLQVTFSTTDNDVLYVPNKQNNVLPQGATYFSIITQSPASYVNLFNKIECSYFAQFEIDYNLPTSGVTKSLISQINGNNINNIFYTNLVFYDNNGIYVPYGTQDTIFDSNYDLIDLNNDFPFLYDYHWIKQNFDVVTFNNVYFPYIVVGNVDGSSIIDNTTNIMNNNLNPTFQLLMDYPSFFGNESVTLNVTQVSNGQLLEQVPVSFSIGQSSQNYTLNLSLITFNQSVEQIKVSFDTFANVLIGTPSDYIINVTYS